MAVQAPPQSPTERSAVDLAHAIRSGETSSREVVEAHIEQLLRTHERINAVVADRYEAARAESDAADALVADNAYDRTRTAGGSTGGEGAAVRSGGSPLGLAADIAGSIRLPAFFNGVFGLKSSPGLVPSTGQFPMPETETAAKMLTIGPITRRAAARAALAREITGR